MDDENLQRAVTLPTSREQDWADQLAEANRINAELRAAVIPALGYLDQSPAGAAIADRIRALIGGK